MRLGFPFLAAKEISINVFSGLFGESLLLSRIPNLKIDELDL